MHSYPKFEAVKCILSLKKSNLYHTRGILRKRVTSGWAYLQGLTPGQHSSKWQAIGDTVANLNRPGSEPQTYRVDNAVFNHYTNRLAYIELCSLQLLSTDFEKLSLH